MLAYIPEHRFGFGNVHNLCLEFNIFVGRETELDALDDQWREAKQGCVRVVNVVGDAGIGKSRLVHEFRRRLGPDNVFFLQGHCAADRRAQPLLPFVEVVRTSFRIAEDEATEAIRRKLKRGLNVLAMDPEPVLPYLLNLLGQPVDDPAIRALASEVVATIRRAPSVALSTGASSHWRGGWTSANCAMPSDSTN